MVRYSQYIRQMLYIDWRRYMTEHFVEKWLQRNAYYGIQLAGSVDNADQRIQEDLHLSPQGGDATRDPLPSDVPSWSSRRRILTDLQ